MFRLICLIFLLLINNALFSQKITLMQAGEFADALIAKDFLTPKGKEILIKEIKKENIEVNHPSIVKQVTHTSNELTKLTILQFCLASIVTEQSVRIGTKNGWKIDDKIEPKEELVDSGGRTYHLMHYLGGNSDYRGSISHKTSVFGYTRFKTLRSFYEVGLINDSVYKECERALPSRELIDELALFRLMMDRSVYYAYYDLNKEQQLEHILKLEKAGILSPGSYDAIAKSYEPYELKSTLDILAHSPRFRLINLEGYPPDPILTYPVIFQKVKELLPQFEYENLELRIIEEKDFSLIRQDVQIKFKINGEEYGHRVFHNYRHPNPAEDRNIPASPIQEDFHKVVNKWLTDIGSNQRLFEISSHESDTMFVKRKIGIMMLSEGEEDLIRDNISTISQEIFDESLSRENLDTLINELRGEGFFKHLSEAQIDSSYNAILFGVLVPGEELFYKFPKSVVFVEWETGNLENPYEELTRQFSEASRGAFQFTNIVDEYKKGWKKAKQVKYGFTLNGKRYETLLKFDGDWLDSQFLELIKKALKENEIQGAFYLLSSEGYLFLTPSQFNFLSEKFPGMIAEEKL